MTATAKESWLDARQQLRDFDARSHELSTLLNAAKNSLSSSKAELDRLVSEKGEVEAQLAATKVQVQAAQEEAARCTTSTLACDSFSSSLAIQLRLLVNASADARAGLVKEMEELQATLAQQRARVDAYRQSTDGAGAVV